MTLVYIGGNVMKQQEGCFMEGVKKVLHRINNRIYQINGRVCRFEHLGIRGDSIEVWYENNNVKRFIDSMPFQTSVCQIFDIYQYESKMKYKYLLITDDKVESDNWYYPDDKTWVITLKGIMDTVMKTLENGGIDIQSLKQYVQNEGMKV